VEGTSHGYPNIRWQELRKTTKNLRQGSLMSLPLSILIC